MEIIKTVSSSFARAKDHLRDLQKTSWLGRSVASYFFVGGIVLAIGLIVRAIFSRSTPKLPKEDNKTPTPSQNPVRPPSGRPPTPSPSSPISRQPSTPPQSLSRCGSSSRTMSTMTIDITAKDFCSAHQIQLKSPLMEEFENIKKLHRGWTEPSENSVWDSRTIAVNHSIQSVLKLIESMRGASPWKEGYERLEDIQKRLSSRDKAERLSAYVSYEQMKVQLGLLISAEQGQTEAFLASAQSEFQKIQIPILSNLSDYLQTLGLEESNYSSILRCSQQVLGERGIEKLEDIVCLQLDRFDQDKLDLELFQILLRSEPPAHLSGSIVQALFRYLQQLGVKIANETQQTYMTSREGFLENCAHFTEVLQKFNPSNGEEASQQLDTIVQEFKQWYLLMKQTGLRNYIHQYEGAKFWQEVKPYQVSSLHTLCGMTEKRDLNDLYQLNEGCVKAAILRLVAS